MDKSRMSIKKIRQYLRELSVIVIGIAITLSASNWIANRNEKRNLVYYLNSLKIELEQNAVSFENSAKLFQKPIKYANYIRTHDEKTINQDTMRYYAQSDNDGYGSGLLWTHNVYSKNAFEMFKTSGVMSQVNDKELLIAILGTYNAMENVQIFLNMCFEQKREESMREWWYQKTEGRPISMPMQRFHMSDLPYHMAQDCAEMSELIKETLLQLEQTKMIK